MGEASLDISGNLVFMAGSSAPKVTHSQPPDKPCTRWVAAALTAPQTILERRSVQDLGFRSFRKLG